MSKTPITDAAILSWGDSPYVLADDMRHIELQRADLLEALRYYALPGMGDNGLRARAAIAEAEGK